MLNSVPKFNNAVIHTRTVTDSTYVLRVERNNFTFNAGQFVNIGFSQGNTTREYSIYSGINDPFLEFLIREIPGGALSPALRLLRTGATIQIDGPYDEMFTIKKSNLNKRHLLIGTGTGISPYHSFVLSHPDLQYHILHGIAYTMEQYDSFEYANDCYTPCISRESCAFNGRVTDYLQSNHPKPNDIIYLCGSSSMIYSVTDFLAKIGHPSENIFAENFF